MARRKTGATEGRAPGRGVPRRRSTDRSHTNRPRRKPLSDHTWQSPNVEELHYNVARGVGAYMYQARVSNLVIPDESTVAPDVDEAMWELFVAIGDFWSLGDDPRPYRLRLRAFLANRISFSPLYRDFYVLARKVIDDLGAQFGTKAKAYEQIFTQKPRVIPTSPPQTQLEFVQQYVANEFIALRLALGSFKSFGAINYCGYFGGANINGQPVPYRTPLDSK